jgi:hypothetical protein
MALLGIEPVLLLFGIEMRPRRGEGRLAFAIARRTPERVCVSVTMPTFLPSADLRSAAAIGIGAAVGAGAVAASAFPGVLLGVDSLPGAAILPTASLTAGLGIFPILVSSASADAPASINADATIAVR